MTNQILTPEIEEFLISLKKEVNFATGDHEAFVKRWTDIECRYQIVLVILYSRLSHYPYYAAVPKSIQSIAALKAIVCKSPIGQLIEYDESTGLLMYKSSVSQDTIDEVEKILVTKGQFLVD